MYKDTIQDVTKDDLKHLKKVFEYRSRTIAVLFVENTEILLKKWEQAQFELGSKYQYHAENGRIWDYYLAICCNFDEKSLLNETRFNIENDRFCCRKVFIFNLTESNFTTQALLEDLFPKIESPEKISLLSPEELTSTLNVQLPLSQDFFVRQWENSEVKKLADQLVLKAMSNDKNI